ncbi:MAG: hypothetical protein ACJA08_002033 [Cyclobacteriaceae bacterium]|jgi:hypothetical protein
MKFKIGIFGSIVSDSSFFADYPNAVKLGRKSLTSLGNFLETLGDNEVVLIMDADHVITKAMESEYAIGFERQNCDILFAASAAFHCDDDVLRYYFWKFYPRPKSVYHYLDSNAFIGKVGSIKNLIAQIKHEYPEGFSIHDLFTRFYIDYLLNAVSSDLIIKLDRNQELFGNLEGRRSAFKWPMLSWMHTDLFLRYETASLVKVQKTHFQDNLWDIDHSDGDIAFNKRQKTNPSIWITSGDLGRISKRLKNISPGRKGVDVFLKSFTSYLKSLTSFLYAWLVNRGETRLFRIFRYSANASTEWKQTMKKFLQHLERNEGFTFAHFNDGELTFIKKYINEDHSETWFGRRQQKYTKQLGSQLTKALKLDQERYYVGVPCSTHHPRLRKLADELVAGQKNVVPAMSLHHNPRFFPNIINHMKDRQVFFVKNEYQKLDIFEKLGVEIKEENQIIVPFKNSYLLYDELKDRLFPDGAIVILICGMLAKIIIPEWFERNPNTTFIALGSSMDDFIQRTNTKFQLYPKNGLPLTCNIQPTKYFAFGWKKECKECWMVEDHFDLPC